jgi:hypothetical protein
LNPAGPEREENSKKRPDVASGLFCLVV